MVRRVCFPFLGRTIGGSHHSTLLLAKNLDRARYEPLIVLHEEGPLEKLVSDYGLSYEILPLPFLPFAASDVRPWHFLSLRGKVAAAKDMIRQKSIDIIHLDGGVLRFLWHPAARATRAKYAHSQRTPLFGFSVEKALSFPSFDLVLCNSQYTADSLPFTVRRKAKIVYPPLDTLRAAPDRAACRDEVLARYGLAPDTVLIGFLANLQARKRPAMIPEIARIMRDEGIVNFMFLMAGDQYDEAASDTFALIRDYGLEKHVVFTGFAPDPAAFLAACSVMVAPAVKEAFGRTLTEAMLAGTLVLASGRCGHREVIEDGRNGLLVPADDPCAFAEQIIACMERPADYADIARTAAQEARQKYDVRTIAGQLMDLYDGI